MHHPTDRIIHHERTLLPQSYIWLEEKERDAKGEECERERQREGRAMACHNVTSFESCGQPKLA